MLETCASRQEARLEGGTRPLRAARLPRETLRPPALDRGRSRGLRRDLPRCRSPGLRPARRTLPPICPAASSSAAGRPEPEAEVPPGPSAPFPEPPSRACSSRLVPRFRAGRPCRPTLPNFLERRYSLRNVRSVRALPERARSAMIHLVHRMKLGPWARSDMRGFWNRLKGRERRCRSVIEDGFRPAPSTRKADDARESRRSVRASGGNSSTRELSPIFR